MNPYDALDLPRHASQADVKRAYRRRAKTVHPDAGGSADAFAKLTKSYLVLVDPVRREKFDRTGTIDPSEPDNSLGRAVSTIVGFFAAAAQQHPDPTKVDLVHEAKNNFEQNIRTFEEQRRKIERTLEKFTAVEKRLKSRKKKPTAGVLLLQQAMRANIDSARVPLAQIERQIQPFKDALVLIEDFVFEVDEVKRSGSFSLYGASQTEDWRFR